MPIKKMVSIRITDSGEFLDTEGARLSYSVQSFDLRDMAVRTGEFSIDFMLPDIPSNREKLNFAPEDFLSGNTTFKRIDVEILQNGELIKAGFLQVTSREQNIMVTFFTGASDWISLLEGSLRDVDLSDFDHTYNLTDIEAALLNTSGFVYPLIDYGTWSGKTGLTDDRVSLFDLFPAVYVNDLVKIMFREIGWKLDGEVLDDIWFQRLIIPFSNSEFSHKAPWASDRRLVTSKSASQSRVGAADTISFPNEIVDSILWDGTDTFTADTSMRVDINVSCTFSGATTSPELEIFAGVIIEGTTTITGAGDFEVSASFDFDISSGSDIIIRVTSVGGTWTITSGSLKIDVSSAIIGPGAIDFEFSSMLPEITKVDFMKYIFIHRGILATTDNFSRTVTLSYFRSIPQNGQDDWTSKVDGIKKVEYEELLQNYGKNTRFRYRGSEDEKLKEYEVANGKNYGDGIIEIGNDFLENDVEFYEAPFAGTINFQSLKGNGNLSFIQFSANGTDFTELQDPTFRILYVMPNWNLVNFISRGNIFFDGGIGEKTVGTFSWFAKIRLQANDDMDEGLAFDPPDDSAIYSVGTIERYMKEFDRIFQNPKIETFRLRLTEVDVREFDITKPVFISQVGGGKLYYKNKLLNFEDGKISQDVELIPFE